MSDSTPSRPLEAPVEIVRDPGSRGPFRAALFDFDGTLSLLRRNWQDVMIPMMVEVLSATGTSETPEALHEAVREFVLELNGRQTIYQMIRLAEEVRHRGGRPLDPLDYKHEYHSRLSVQVEARKRSLALGTHTVRDLTVPGAHDWLADLRKRGWHLVLASGTDVGFVREEARLLELEEYFGEHIYGALDDYKKFSKAQVIRRILEDTAIPGNQLVGFGDGFVETEEVRRVGGLAVGVASDEVVREGVNAWKRERLLRAGADLIVGDFSNPAPLRKVLRLT